MRSTAFESGIVVELLQALADEVTGSRGPRGLLAEVASAVSGGRFEPALQATDKLRASLGVLVARYQRLHANVVPIDELGAVESIGELVLRARQMVITTQLNRLCAALRDAGAQDRARGWFVGQFQRIDDVAAFFEAELAAINGQWTRYREHHVRPAGMSNADRRAIYQVAVRVAQRALCDLAEHPDVAYLVRAAHTATDWPEVQSAIAELTAALALQLEIESGRPPAIATSPARPPGPAGPGTP